jgi:hypothetical protein
MTPTLFVCLVPSNAERSHVRAKEEKCVEVVTNLQLAAVGLWQLVKFSLHMVNKPS